mmetsp:Transcript_36569/g.85714  ORF Transcript_36569/g.85714 Transcript_36569/m.85714 type:complete len:326 (-) Transcript_36569:16-993(-)
MRFPLVCLAMEAVLGFGAPEAVQLLQHRLQLEGPRPQEQRLKAAEPINWVHFPKCGSSFLNAIIHLPGVCPVAANFTISEQSLGPCFLQIWTDVMCSQMCDQDKFRCKSDLSLPHPPIDNYLAEKGTLMGFFRDPDQRILSGYHDDMDNFASVDFRKFLHKYDEEPLSQMTDCTSEEGSQKVPLLDFAESWKGGMTYQLVVEHPTTQTLDPDRKKMTHADAVEAARRVQDGFAFVGITEQWNLSICLFRKMFGGLCQESDFIDTRPSDPGKSAHQAYDNSELLGWHDDIDEVVYSAALDVFRANLILFNVSHATCQECYIGGGVA